MSVWFEDIQNAALDQFKIHQKSLPSGFVKVMPCGQVSNVLGLEQTFNFSSTADKVKQFQIFPRGYMNVEKDIRSFDVRDDDIWISSFPKCGTTWTQEMVWNIVNNVDLEQARSVTLDKRIPFLELTSLYDQTVLDSIDDGIFENTISISNVKQLFCRGETRETRVV